MDGDQVNTRRRDYVETPTEEAHKKGLITGLVVGIIGGGIVGGIIGAALDNNRPTTAPVSSTTNNNRIFGTPEGRDVNRGTQDNLRRDNGVNPGASPTSPEGTNPLPPGNNNPPGSSNNTQNPQPDQTVPGQPATPPR